MTTTATGIRWAGTVAVLAGTAVLTAAPSYAGPVPEDPVTASSTSQQQPGGTAHNQLETGIAGSPGMAAQVQAKLEAIESAQRSDAQQGTVPTRDTTDSSDPSSVPVTILALLGGGLVVGAAGYTVYRFRHHGHVGAATA